jgi:hypothetical protein
VQSSIQWLVDTKERAMAYADLARAYNLTLRMSIEIDVGLHRGGAFNASVMLDILRFINGSAPVLQWTGFMGYDGHVPNDPLLPIEGPPRFYQQLSLSADTYATFIDAARAEFPSYFAGRWPTFNGAGSLTISAYQQLNQSSPLNDYAIGSGFLKPSDL